MILEECVVPCHRHSHREPLRFFGVLSNHTEWKQSFWELPASQNLLVSTKQETTQWSWLHFILSIWNIKGKASGQNVFFLFISLKANILWSEHFFLISKDVCVCDKGASKYWSPEVKQWVCESDYVLTTFSTTDSKYTEMSTAKPRLASWRCTKHWVILLYLTSWYPSFLIYKVGCVRLTCLLGFFEGSSIDWHQARGCGTAWQGFSTILGSRH